MSTPKAMSSEETTPSTLVKVIYTTSITVEVEGDLNVEQVAEKIKEGEFTVLGSEEDPTKDQLQEVVTKAIADENYDDADWLGSDSALYPLLIDARPYFDKD